MKTTKKYFYPIAVILTLFVLANCKARTRTALQSTIAQKDPENPAALPEIKNKSLKPSYEFYLNRLENHLQSKSNKSCQFTEELSLSSENTNELQLTAKDSIKVEYDPKGERFEFFRNGDSILIIEDSSRKYSEILGPAEDGLLNRSTPSVINISSADFGHIQDGYYRLRLEPSTDVRTLFATNSQLKNKLSNQPAEVVGEYIEKLKTMKASYKGFSRFDQSDIASGRYKPINDIDKLADLLDEKVDLFKQIFPSRDINPLTLKTNDPLTAFAKAKMPNKVTQINEFLEIRKSLYKESLAAYLTKRDAFLDEYNRELDVIEDLLKVVPLDSVEQIENVQKYLQRPDLVYIQKHIKTVFESTEMKGFVNILEKWQLTLPNKTELQFRTNKVTSLPSQIAPPKKIDLPSGSFLKSVKKLLTPKTKTRIKIGLVATEESECQELLKTIFMLEMIQILDRNAVD